MTTTETINVKYWKNYTVLSSQENHNFYIIAGTFTLDGSNLFRLGVGYKHQTTATMIPIHASLCFLNGLLSSAIHKRDNNQIKKLTEVIEKMNDELNSFNDPI